MEYKVSSQAPYSSIFSIEAGTKTNSSSQSIITIALKPLLTALSNYLTLKEELKENGHSKDEQNKLNALKKNFSAEKQSIANCCKDDLDLIKLKKNIIKSLQVDNKHALNDLSFDSESFLASYSTPHNLQVLFSDMGIQEIIKNTIDALITLYLQTSSIKERENLPTEAILTLEVVNADKFIEVIVSDNGGGYPASYLKSANTLVNELNVIERITKVYQTESSQKKEKTQTEFFLGGNNLGMNYLFLLMLDGIALETNQKLRKLYDFSSQPMTKIELSNKTLVNGQVGAQLKLVAPRIAIPYCGEAEITLEELKNSLNDAKLEFLPSSDESSKHSEQSDCSTTRTLEALEQANETELILENVSHSTNQLSTIKKEAKEESSLVEEAPSAEPPKTMSLFERRKKLKALNAQQDNKTSELTSSTKPPKH